MNPKTLGIIFIGLVVALGYFFLKDVESVTPPKNTIIVAFGDSLVQGVGATEGNDFVSLVSRKMGLPIINEGRSGDTTETALARIDQVLSHDPGVVIVLLGGNDYLRRVPKATTFGNLQKIVSTLKAQDIRVILLGVRGGLLRDTYEEDFADLAKKNDLLYVPNVLNGLIGNKEYMSDEIHPNDKGYAVIAERVLKKVREVIANK